MTGLLYVNTFGILLMAGRAAMQWGAALFRKYDVLRPARTDCGDSTILHRPGLSSCDAVVRRSG